MLEGAQNKEAVTQCNFSYTSPCKDEESIVRQVAEDRLQGVTYLTTLQKVKDRLLYPQLAKHFFFCKQKVLHKQVRLQLVS